MSQILIISDTHFLRKNKLDKFIQQFPDIKHIIHCGDIYPGYQPGHIQHLYLCKGNNDFSNTPHVAHITIDNVTFMITHGHLQDRASRPQKLKELLEQYPSDVICFGHTHIPYFYQDEGIIIINPGSLSLGREYPRRNTYAIFDTKTRQVHFYNAQTNEEIKIESHNK